MTRHQSARTETDAFGLYVHWPFCLSKCPYCDFNSHVRKETIEEDRFARAIAREIETLAARLPGRTVSTVFFGGGTPSLMRPDTVETILAAVGRSWKVAPDAEITLEANPGSADASRFRGYRATGVTRLSLGIQSFDDASLRLLGRIHDAAEAREALALARATFDHVSFDLIYALPGQTLAVWKNELGRALAEETEHLSLYQLTVEPRTPFAALREVGRLTTPDEASARDLYDLTIDLCAQAGLPAYEISNHARPGTECRHNLVYWRGREYAGVGPGAHGRLDIGGERHATATEKRPEPWLMRVEAFGHGIVTDEILTREERGDEFLLMGLRLAEGIDPARYAAIAGRALDQDRVRRLSEEGAIAIDPDGRLRVTQAGFPLLDAVVADLAA